MTSLIRLLAFSKPYWRRALAATVSLIAITLTSLSVPGLLRAAIDLGLTQNDAGLIAAIGLALIGLGLIRSLLNFVQRYYAEWLSHRLAYDIRNALYERIQRLSFGYHDRAQTGQLLARCTEDASNVQRFVGFALVDLINVVLLFTGILVVLFITHASLTLVALIPIPFLLAYTIRFGVRITPYFTRIDQALARISTILQETLTGMQVVKAFAREADQRARFVSGNRELFDSRVTTIRYWASAMPLMSMFIVVSTALVIGFGGQLVIEKALTLGQLVAFNSYVLLLAQPVQRMGWIVNMLGEAVASAVRIFEVLDTPIAIADRPGAIGLPPLQGRVEFDRVTFAYQQPAQPDALDGEHHATVRAALREVSFVAEPDQVVALIGPTGSGKSTIINLIPRFYDVTSGAVRVDGVDVREVNLQSLRSQIGIVLQESILFSMSIRENIAFGRPDVTEAEVAAAAQAARAHDFIAAFPAGYDTIVGEKGVTLSGGQRQRVAIARALLMNPRILILDDSTSSVDMQTEYAIQQALAELMRGRTTFVIAQRLTTVKRADQILVLDQGRIVQRGTHVALLAEGGLYREVYDLQLRDQEELRRDLLWVDEMPANGQAERVSVKSSPEAIA
ncbi:MAG TPA: ABC transporter ATP-binding protein [Anaerolineae bacterium]|nr:ABC transporter ATP-binding protein [Anaerolineae bacterium]